MHAWGLGRSRSATGPDSHGGLGYGALLGLAHTGPDTGGTPTAGPDSQGAFGYGPGLPRAQHGSRENLETRGGRCDFALRAHTHTHMCS